ncbi:MAG: hypothetical protein K1X64_12150 [Myxococcaceae bacterium]|nr:hypothetical protein [Myxococcaceae bacterium]
MVPQATAVSSRASHDGTVSTPLRRLAAAAADAAFLFSPDRRSRLEQLADQLDAHLDLTAYFFEGSADGWEAALSQTLAFDTSLTHDDLQQLKALGQQAYLRFLAQHAVSEAKLLQQREGESAALDDDSEAAFVAPRGPRIEALLQRTYGALLRELAQFLKARPWPRTLAPIERQALEKVRYISIQPRPGAGPALVFHYAGRDRIKPSTFESALTPYLAKLGLRLELSPLRTLLVKRPAGATAALRDVFTQYPELESHLLEIRADSKAASARLTVTYRDDLLNAGEMERHQDSLRQKLRARGYAAQLNWTPVSIGAVAERIA